MNQDNILEISNLHKKLKKFSLDINELQIPKGFATALIGENGAGKSILFNILGGIRRDYTGTITYFDEQTTKTESIVKDRIGFSCPNNFFLPSWTIKQIIGICSILYPDFNKDKFNDYCERLGICNTNFFSQNKKVKTLSDGSRMKLSLACVFSRNTSLLLLDEPTSPLDPLMRDCLCNMIRNYIANGGGEKSVFFSTHNIADMESITDYVVILENGRVVEQGFVEDLKEKYILVKGEPSDFLSAKPFLYHYTESVYGFEGICLAKNLDKLAGMDITVEIPTLSQLSVAIMKHHSILTL